MKPLVIIGIGGHGREALDIVSAINDERPTYDVLGFFDDAVAPGTTAEPHDLDVLGPVSKAAEMDVDYIVAIGVPAIRRSIASNLPIERAASIIHPRASIGSHVSHGPGLIVAAGAVITHAVTLGDHVHVNVGATISHDSNVGHFVTVTPGAHIGGAVDLEDEVWMGIGSSAIQGVTIGARTTVGAGAAIIGDVPSDVTVVGVPGRVVKDHRGRSAR